MGVGTRPGYPLMDDGLSKFTLIVQAGDSAIPISTFLKGKTCFGKEKKEKSKENTDLIIEK